MRSSCKAVTLCADIEVAKCEDGVAVVDDAERGTMVMMEMCQGCRQGIGEADAEVNVAKAI